MSNARKRKMDKLHERITSILENTFGENAVGTVIDTLTGRNDAAPKDPWEGLFQAPAYKPVEDIKPISLMDRIVPELAALA